MFSFISALKMTLKLFEIHNNLECVWFRRRKNSFELCSLLSHSPDYFVATYSNPVYYFRQKMLVHGVDQGTLCTLAFYMNSPLIKIMGHYKLTIFCVILFAIGFETA